VGRNGLRSPPRAFVIPSRVPAFGGQMRNPCSPSSRGQLSTGRPRIPRLRRFRASARNDNSAGLRPPARNDGRRFSRHPLPGSRVPSLLRPSASRVARLRVLRLPFREPRCVRARLVAVGNSSEQLGAAARGRRRAARSCKQQAARSSSTRPSASGSQLQAASSSGLSAHRWVATIVSFAAIGVQLRSGSNRVIAAASSAVFSPRSRCHTMPS